MVSDSMLPTVLLDRVLTRLGLGTDVSIDLVGLERVYTAWCRHVPFDNLQKRAWFVEQQGPLPGGDARSFFESYLDEGTGGTCWATSRSLWALLVSLGFPARRSAGTMISGPNAPLPEAMLTHGTVTVRLDGIDHLVDTHMLTSKPLPLIPGETTSVPGPFGARATPTDLGDALFRVWFSPWNGRVAEMSCLIQRFEVDEDLYRERHERSRGASPFNAHAYVRRRTADGPRLVVLGSQVAVADDRTMSAAAFASREQRDAHLVSLGYASGLVARVPNDEPPPPA